MHFWLLILVYNLGYQSILLFQQPGRFQQAELRWWGLLTGFVVAVLVYGAILHLLGRRRARLGLTRFHRTFILLSVLIAAVGIGVGIRQGNDLVYMLSDTYKILLIPAILLIGALLPLRGAGPRTFRFLLAVVAVGQIWFEGQKVIEAASGGFHRVPFKMWPNLLLLFALFWAFVLRPRRIGRRMYAAGGLLLGLGSGASLLSGYRTPWLAFVWGGLVALFVDWRRVINRIPVLLSYLAAILLVGALLMTTAGEMIREPIEKAASRFTELLTSGPMDIGSVGTKAVEVRYSFAELAKAGAYGLMFGMGSGAEYEVAEDLYAFREYAKRGYLVHNIHILPMALLFRHGILGLLAYTCLLIGTVRSFRVANRRFRGTQHSIIATTSLLYIIIIIPVLFSFSLFVGDANLGVLMAILAGLGSAQERECAQPASGDRLVGLA